MKNLKVVFAVIFCSFISLNFTFADAVHGTNLSGSFTIQQKSNNRYVDAYDYKGTDYAVVSRPRQKNNTQKWIFTKVDLNTYTIQQKSTGRYLDAYDYNGTDYKVVLRPRQKNDTQKWIVRKVGKIYTIQQKSTRRYLDAHEYAGKDFALVTRTAQKNNTQKWIIKRATTKLSPMNKAVKASLYGPSINDVKLFGHEYNFWKTIKVTKKGSRKVVTGRFSHAIRFARNDKYYFTATFDSKGNLISFERKIKEGFAIVTPIIKYVANELVGKIPFVGSKIQVTDSHIDYLAKVASGKLGKTSWEKAADEIALILAVAALKK